MTFIEEKIVKVSAVITFGFKLSRTVNHASAKINSVYDCQSVYAFEDSLSLTFCTDRNFIVTDADVSSNVR